MAERCHSRPAGVLEAPVCTCDATTQWWWWWHSQQASIHRSRQSNPTAVASEVLRCVQELVRAMTEPRNAVLRQYEALLARHGARLSVSDCAQRGIAAEARRRGTGARGLRSLLEDLLLDARFEAPRHPTCDVLLEAPGAPPSPAPPM